LGISTHKADMHWQGHTHTLYRWWMFNCDCAHCDVGISFWFCFCVCECVPLHL